MGVNSRGNALAQNFAYQKECEVIHICDVDKDHLFLKQIEHNYKVLHRL